MYKLTINGSEPYGVKEYYKEGELVKIDFPFMTDTSLYVWSDDVEGKMERGEGCEYFCFEMPDHDVNVLTRTESTMMNKYNDPPVMGMFPFGRQFVKLAEVKGFFCPECGDLLDKEWKYCPKCGNKIES